MLVHKSVYSFSWGFFLSSMSLLYIFILFSTFLNLQNIFIIVIRSTDLIFCVISGSLSVDWVFFYGNQPYIQFLIGCWTFWIYISGFCDTPLNIVGFCSRMQSSYLESTWFFQGLLLSFVRVGPGQTLGLIQPITEAVLHWELSLMLHVFGGFPLVVGNYSPPWVNSRDCSAYYWWFFLQLQVVSYMYRHRQTNIQPKTQATLVQISRTFSLCKSLLK